MGKKRPQTRQRPPKRAAATTSDAPRARADKAREDAAASDDDADAAAAAAAGRETCEHVAGAVSVPVLRKTLPLSAERAVCAGCASTADVGAGADAEAQAAAEAKAEVKPVESGEGADLWVCLGCGAVGCGRSSPGQHALRHRGETADHALVMHALSGRIWCYTCDDEIAPSADAQLRDAVRLLEKDIAPGKPAKMNKAATPRKNSKGKAAEREEAAAPPPASAMAPVAADKLHGLQNLGNTCFFNSVLQALAQTAELQDALEHTVGAPADGAVDALLGRLSLADDAARAHVPLLLRAAREEPPGPLTKSLRSLLVNMRPGEWSTVLNPREVLEQVRRKAPRFEGYRQQDSHELLRYLLDGMRVEEIRRRLPYLEQHGLKDDAKLKQVPTFVDEVFGGRLVSRVVCHVCCTVSNTEEPFLDLSLSIPVPVSAKSGSNTLALPIATPVPSPADKRGGSLRRALGRAQSGATSPTPTIAITVAPDLDEVLERTMSSLQPWKPEWTAPLRTGQEIVLEACLAAFCAKEVLQGDESFSCAECGKRAAAAEPSSPARSPSPSRSPVAALMKRLSLTRSSKADGPASDTSSDSVEGGGDDAADAQEPPSPKSSSSKRTLFGGSRRSSTPESAAPAKPPIVYTPATKRFLLRQTPRVLTLHLNRFTQMGFALRKNGERVAFPLRLDVAPFCTPDVPPSETQYELFAIVEHSGGMGGGHYTCTVRAAQPDAAWFHISDSRVSPTTERSALTCQAYLLFYRRC